MLVRAHGFYSAATVLAGAAGIGFRALDILPWWHLVMALPVATVLVVAATNGIGAEGQRPSLKDQLAKTVMPTRAVLVLFLAGGAALYLDNAASDWSGILLRDGYSADPVTVTAAVTAWAIGQAIGRIGFPNLSKLVGKERLAVGMAMTAAIGLALVVSSSIIALAFTGLVLMGLGTSALFPMAIAAAARMGDRPAAINVASLSQMAFLAGIATPIVLGGLVQLVGVRWAFASGAIMLAASLAIQVKRRPFAQVECPARMRVTPGHCQVSNPGKQNLAGFGPLGTPDLIHRFCAGPWALVRRRHFRQGRPHLEVECRTIAMSAPESGERR